jgi:hypothetical protein
MTLTGFRHVTVVVATRLRSEKGGNLRWEPLALICR